jgi:hypothetical protein
LTLIKHLNKVSYIDFILLRCHKTLHYFSRCSGYQDFRVHSSINVFLFHLLMSKKKCDNDFKCKKCNRNFPSMESLKNHEKVHSDDFCGYFCKKCDDLFLHRSGLLRHVDYEHPGRYRETFACKKCSRSFKYMVTIQI